MEYPTFEGVRVRTRPTRVGFVVRLLFELRINVAVCEYTHCSCWTSVFTLKWCHDPQRNRVCDLQKETSGHVFVLLRIWRALLTDGTFKPRAGGLKFSERGGAVREGGASFAVLRKGSQWGRPPNRGEPTKRWLSLRFPFKISLEMAGRWVFLMNQGDGDAPGPRAGRLWTSAVGHDCQFGRNRGRPSGQQL